MSKKHRTLITGASRGIGAAIAVAAARAGHDLALVCRAREDRLAETVQAAQALGASVEPLVCDISDSDAVARLFVAIARNPAPLTGLVNNAGYTGERDSLADMPLDTIERTFSVNLRGTVLCLRGAIPLLAAAGGGGIVNLSSQTASFGGNGLSAYAASKAAINGLTISLARELAPKNIRVNAVSPGPVLTDPLKELPPARLRAIERELPMGRFCTPREVAETVLWLLSPQASYVSGAIVPVHGGR